MEKLLVCIASHNPSERIIYIKKILDTLREYKLDIHIMIDSNQNTEEDLPWYNTIQYFIHPNLEHPYHLTWMHRQHFFIHLNNYDWFMYLEDDMDVPYRSFITYMENFLLLWPLYIPSLVRIEKIRDTLYNTDNISFQSPQIIKIKGKEFVTLSNPYHAFWIMPQKALKETLTKDFVRLDTHREMAASYPMWELKKTPLVMLENGQISSLCYSYHLPNNYATDPWTPFAKIEINKLII